MDIEHRQELFEQYEQEMRLQTGFGHPSRWSDGPRNFAAFILERERDDMLAFIREQVELWDNAGDSGFPLYEHGKRILVRYPSPAKET